MNNEKQFFMIKKSNNIFNWKEVDSEMIFYNYNNIDNFPLIINFPNSNNNIPQYNNFMNEEENKGEINENKNENFKKQNFNIDEFCKYLKKKREINIIYPKENLENYLNNKLKTQDENSKKPNYLNISKPLIPYKNESKIINDEEEEDENVDKLIMQLNTVNDVQNKNKIIKKLILGRKKLHRERLEKFYIKLSKFFNEKIEDIKDWVSLEEKLITIDNLSYSICREIDKYIKVHQSGKIQLENDFSKNFLRVHFIGSIKVKMNDFNLALKNYK